MCELSIKGIDVFLPRPLRPQQKEFMEACMDCFEEGKIGMLESAYGTGRTISLLCTSLGWLLHNTKEKGTKYVVYLCNSDWNIERVVSKFSKTKYAHLAKDLLTKSRHESNVSTPRIIFSTHDYFFRELISISGGYPFKFDLPNALVILDDSHLIEDACRAAASVTLSLCKIDQIIQELLKEVNQDSKTQKVISKLENLKNIFRGIVPHHGNDLDPSYGGQEINALFHRIKLDELDVLILKEYSYTCEVVQFISHISIFCDDEEEAMSSEENNVQKVKQKDLESFKMYVTENCFKSKQAELCKADKCKTLHFLCLDPSVVIRRLLNMKPHSIVFTGTTVAPFGQLKSELGILESKEFINKSIIEDHQIFARIVTCGVGGYYLNSSYNRRFDEDYLTSVGKSVLEVAKVTPNGQGMIVYFSSYEFLNWCKSHWETYKLKGETLWQTISEHKDIFAVSADDVSFCDFPERLNSLAVKKKGCCVLAVLRGEVSKDTSITIDHKRVIIIVGVPYLPLNEPAIKLKIDYKESKRRLSSAGFIDREAYKAINLITNHQINLNSEYGVILLFDVRFKDDQLSLWLKDQIRSEKRFTEMLQELKDFFNSIEKRTEWTKATSENPTQSSTQFGSVQSWEMEKLRLNYIKLKKKNTHCENYLQRVREQLSIADSEKEALERKLVELNMKEMDMKTQGKPQSSNNLIGADTCSNTQQGTVLSQECVQSGVSSRKRPYPQ